MLSSVAIFGGSKGMVAMPNLSGLSRDAAITAIQSNGLVFLSSSNVDSTSENNNKVVSQSVSAGTLVDYESSITIGIGLYTAPSGPVITFVTDPTVYEVNDGDYECSPITQYTKIQDRKNITYTYRYVDGVKDNSYTPTQNFVSQANTIFTANSADCGYVAPPAVTCTTSQTLISNGSCNNGYKTKTVMDVTSCSDGTQSSGSPYNITEECCVSLGTTYTNSTACNCGYKESDAYTSTLCGSVTTTTYVGRVTLSCVGGGCTGAQ
jgi:hypothetical protein